MVDLKKQLQDFKQSFAEQGADISENDPRLIADYYSSNLPFHISSGILLCVLSGIGLLSTISPYPDGEVLPEISARAVYQLIFVFNSVSVILLFLELKRFHGTAEKRTKIISSWFMGINMALAGITFFAAQEHSGFFFEYILVTITISLLPHLKHSAFIRNAVINAASASAVLISVQRPIALQDILDFVILFIICDLVNWLHWQSFLGTEVRKFAAEKEKDELYHDSRTDELTGILNRTALREDLSNYAGHTLDIALIDMDSFKTMNDTYGHAYGDRILQTIGRKMREVFHDPEDRCYRYGGDEFLIISDSEDAGRFYQKLIQFNESSRKQGDGPAISCGIGYCIGKADAERGIRSLIQIADSYLYQAKDSGTGRVEGNLTPVDLKEYFQKKRTSVSDRLNTVNDAAEQFHQELMEDKPWSLAYLNISRFAEINEEFGYREGRILIEKIGSLIFHHIPDAVLVNREVDHFVLFSSMQEEAFVQGIQAVQAEAANLEERQMIIIRAGILHHEAKDAPMDFATGMYRAKYACETAISSPYLCFYDQKMEQERAKEIFVHNAFSEALSNASIVPYYQPIVGSLSGTTCGYEALSRWINPEKGMIPPADFIPYLENSGEIYRLDLFLLEQVCRDLQNHKAQFPEGIFVNINLSQKDFQYANLPEEIDRIVSEYHVSRAQIQLEITESAFAEAKLLGNAIRKLQNLGFRIWMDDFGVGESSLSAFRTYQVKGVKLDQSFFADYRNQRTQIIIRSIIDMSHETSCMMIAEGIETLDQLICARQWGLNFIQGFFFSKPMPLSELLASPFVRNMTDECTDRYYQAAAEVPLGALYKPDDDLIGESNVIFSQAVLELGPEIRVFRADDRMEALLHDLVETDGNDRMLKQHCELSDALSEASKKISVSHRKCDFQVKLGTDTLHGQLALLAENPESGRKACILNLTNAVLHVY